VCPFPALARSEVVPLIPLVPDVDDGQVPLGTARPRVVARFWNPPLVPVLPGFQEDGGEDLQDQRKGAVDRLPAAAASRKPLSTRNILAPTTTRPAWISGEFAKNGHHAISIQIPPSMRSCLLPSSTHAITSTTRTIRCLSDQEATDPFAPLVRTSLPREAPHWCVPTMGLGNQCRV
jgi:hypothetical protein